MRIWPNGGLGAAKVPTRRREAGARSARRTSPHTRQPAGAAEPKRRETLDSSASHLLTVRYGILYGLIQSPSCATGAACTAESKGESR